MINRLGGTTGDTAGAMIEIIETVALVALTLG
jgi:cobalamin synthase